MLIWFFDHSSDLFCDVLFWDEFWIACPFKCLFLNLRLAYCLVTNEIWNDNFDSADKAVCLLLFRQEVSFKLKLKISFWKNKSLGILK